MHKPEGRHTLNSVVQFSLGDLGLVSSVTTNNSRRDPTAGPAEDVVNFLEELYAQGYHYRSLNAYCSAISLIHEHVDGQSVGQHPLVSH